MEAYLNFINKYAKSILLTLVAITVIFATRIVDLTEDSNPYLLPQSHPARSAIYKMREEFTGTYDSILIAVHNKTGIFNKTSLNAIFELTQQSRKIILADETDMQALLTMQERYAANTPLVQTIQQILDGGFQQQDGVLIRQLLSKSTAVEGTDKKYLQVLAERIDPIRELAGISATENMELSADGTLLVNIPVNKLNMDPERIKTTIMGNELMDMGAVDKTGNTGLIVVEISILEDDSTGQVRAYDTVRSLVEKYQAEHPEFTDEIFIGGVPVFFAEQKKILDHDLGVLLPAVIVLVAIMLALFFRTAAGVLIPMVNVMMCTIWTLGMMAIANVPMDIITSALPVFLITICSSDAIHVIAEYYRQRGIQESNTVAISMTMRLMVSPVILTTITTCLTFLVSTTTSIENLKNFGVFMSFGMFVAMLISLLLIPAWLCLLKQKRDKRGFPKSENREYLINRVLLSLLRPVMQNRKKYMAVFATVIIIFGYMATQVRVDDMGSAYFSENNTFRLADEFINSNIAGTSPAWIEIDTKKVDGVFDIEVVGFIDKLEKYLHSFDNVTFSYSPPRFIRRINYVMNDKQAEYNRLPHAVETFIDKDPETGEIFTETISGKEINRQAVLLFENSGGSDFTNVFNSDFSKAVLLFTMNTTVASDYQALLDALTPWIDKNKPAHLTYSLAGSPVIWTAVLDELLDGQLLSIFLAFTIVILVMSVWLRSLKMGLAGTLPLIVTVVIYYACMTLFDIELNIGTAIISFLVLGIVDYSVHYLLRIKHGQEQGLSLDDAIEAAIRQSGRSIVVNAIIFSFGFIALSLSDFKPIVDLGTLVGLTLLISGIMTLFMITLFAPWLLEKTETETIKGVVKVEAAN